MLVPVLFDDVRIPLEFRRIQVARLIDWDVTPTHLEMVKLLKSVQSLLAAKDTTLAVKPSPAAGSPPRLRWLTGFVTDYFTGRSLWSVRLAVSVAFLASVLLLLLSNKVCMGDYWLRVGSWMLEDKVFVTLLYSLVAGAYLWSALVLFAVSTASDPRYKSIAAIAVVGLAISSLPLFWFSREREIYEFPWVTRTKMAVVCIMRRNCRRGFSRLLFRPPQAVQITDRSLAPVEVPDTPVPAGRMQTSFPADAAKHVGETATVKDRVDGFHQSGKGNIFLNMGGTYTNQAFTVFIPAASAAQFSQAQQYEGRIVAVSGKITLFKGKPEIIVKSPSQISAQ